MDLQSLPDNARVMYFDVSGALVFHVIGRPELTSTSRVNRGECSCNHGGEMQVCSCTIALCQRKIYKTPFMAISLSQLRLVLIVPCVPLALC